MIQLMRAWLARREAIELALEFNRQHTYTSRQPQWMCPACHKVHEPYATSVFTGLQFPACCTFAAGHRLDKQHATGL